MGLTLSVPFSKFIKERRAIQTIPVEEDEGWKEERNLEIERERKAVGKAESLKVS